MVDKQLEDQAEARQALAYYNARGLSRREVIKRAGVGTVALGVLGPLLAACSGDEDPGSVAQEANGLTQGKSLKMLGTNGGLVVSWYAQGKRTMEFWAKAFNVDLTWVDGELDPVKQRAKMDNAATRNWDIAAVTAHEAGTIVQPVKRMIDKGTAVIQMISEVGKPGEDYGYLTWVEQSSFDMGFQVASRLFEKAGGKGTAIETQGPASFTGAQERHRGFTEALKAYPDVKLLTTDFGNWDPARARSLWESYVNKYPDITIGYFHNDDMAFSGFEALKAAGRAGRTLIGGADAMPEAIKAVNDGRFVATYRHSSCRMHLYPVVIGVMHKLGIVKNVPKKIVVDGQLVTPENSESLLFLQQDSVFLE